jgi:hypothetical protein
VSSGSLCLAAFSLVVGLSGGGAWVVDLPTRLDRPECAVYLYFALLARAPGSAGVAQLVEHLICNEVVGGSSPFASSAVVHPLRRDGQGPAGAGTS